MEKTLKIILVAIILIFIFSLAYSLGYNAGEKTKINICKESKIIYVPVNHTEVIKAECNCQEEILNWIEYNKRLKEEINDEKK